MQNSDLKFAFFGTPQISADTLEILKSAGFLPSLIVTATDKPVGRKHIISPPPVKTWAIKNNIPFIQPEKLDSAFYQQLEATSYQLFIIVAYGKILPQELILLPTYGTINIHYSLLPKYRGASPVQSAILNGEKETGVTIQKMVYELDAGPIITQENVTINADETAPQLLNRLIKIGGELLVKILPDFINEKIKTTPQDESLASICKKITKKDGLVNLEAQLPKTIYNKFRAFYDWPGIYFMKNNKKIKITNAILENEQFVIQKIIPEGKTEINYDIWKSNILK